MKVKITLFVMSVLTLVFSLTSVSYADITTRPYKMKKCESKEHCRGNTDFVLSQEGMWFPASFQAKVEIDYGKTVYMIGHKTLPISVSWHWDTNYTDDCKAKVMVSSNRSNWITLTDDLSIKESGRNSWGVITTSENFRYLRVHVGTGVQGQDCGWVGINEVRIMDMGLATIKGINSYGADNTNSFKGKVGIGTTKPKGKLHVVKEDDAAQIILTNGEGSHAGIWQDIEALEFRVNVNDDGKEGDRRIKLYKNGDICIGSGC